MLVKKEFPNASTSIIIFNSFVYFLNKYINKKRG
jgi:hypothetical protein